MRSKNSMVFRCENKDDSIYLESMKEYHKEYFKKYHFENLKVGDYIILVDELYHYTINKKYKVEKIESQIFDMKLEIAFITISNDDNNSDEFSLCCGYATHFKTITQLRKEKLEKLNGNGNKNCRC